MQKLLLLLSLLLATNAWSEDMRLRCSYSQNSGEITVYIITFDKNEGEYAEIEVVGGTTRTTPIRWSPQHITLDYKFQLPGTSIDNTIVINRSDLTSTRRNLFYMSSQEYDHGFLYGTCKVVEIDTSDRKFFSRGQEFQDQPIP